MLVVCCGLTAFSNLLQPNFTAALSRRCCGLTAFSNLLQLILALSVSFIVAA